PDRGGRVVVVEQGDQLADGRDVVAVHGESPLVFGGVVVGGRPAPDRGGVSGRRRAGRWWRRVRWRGRRWWGRSTGARSPHPAACRWREWSATAPRIRWRATG